MGRLVLRYYPVEGTYSSTSSMRAYFGAGTWLHYGAGWEPKTPTMGALAPILSDKVSEPGPYGDYVSAVELRSVGLEPGQFVEQEVFLLDTDGVTVIPLSPENLPMEVYLAGLGWAPYKRWQEDKAWLAGNYELTSYAGGAIEFVLIEGGAEYPLASFWFCGDYFTPIASAWETEGLPPNQDAIRLDESYRAKLTLAAPDVPWQPFWTQLHRAAEEA